MKDCKCPLCGAVTKYVNEKGTHVWVCEDCPFVGFEFYDDGNVESLKDFLTRTI